MRKLLLVVLPLLTTTSVFAQSGAQNFELKKKTCPIVARQAAFAYSVKHDDGKTYQLSKEMESGSLGSIYKWSVDYAQNSATGIDDAVHRATEKCLMNVDQVDRDARNGKQTRVEDLQ